MRTNLEIEFNTADSAGATKEIIRISRSDFDNKNKVLSATLYGILDFVFYKQMVLDRPDCCGFNDGTNSLLFNLNSDEIVSFAIVPR